MTFCPTRQIILAALFAAGAPAGARAQDFYAGKTVTFSTHVAPGGGYDAYVRLLGRHIGRHVPGNPRIIVSNQPGAGGLTAANFFGNLAPKDGTYATLVSQGLLLQEATGTPGLQTSLAKFNWLGNLSQANNVLAVWHTSRAKTIEDAKTFEVVTGSTGVGSISSSLPAVYNAMLGTRFRVVYGYDGAGQLMLAMQRGEIDGRGTNTWVSYKAAAPDDVKNGRIRVLLQIGLRKDPDLPDVPLFSDLVRGDPEKEAIANFLSLGLAISRPVAMPPGAPRERVEIFRRAFAETMSDPAFIEEASRVGAEIDPMTGEETEAAVSRMLGTPRDVIKKAQAAMGG